MKMGRISAFHSKVPVGESSEVKRLFQALDKGARRGAFDCRRCGGPGRGK